MRRLNLKQRSTGKCFKCGLSTKLNIHSKCGKQPEVHRAPDLGERRCESLDCLKMYRPVRKCQKLCPGCMALRDKAIRKSRQEYMYGHYD